MPNIFPPIALSPYAASATVQPEDNVPVPGVLGSVSAPSQASLALVNDQNKLQADTPQKYDYSSHGVLGNVAHVLERFGNIAGDVLDPGATSLIPGSDLFKRRQVAQDQRMIQTDMENKANEQKESDAVESEGANRQEKQSEFEAEAPDRAAKTRNENAQASLAENGKYQVIPTPQGYIRVDPATGNAQHLTVDGQPVGAPVKSEHVQLEIGGKPHTVLVDSTTGNVIHDLGPTGEKPPTVNVNAGSETVNVPDGQGGFTVQRAKPGDHIAAGAVTASGMNSENVPTSSTRTMVESAPGVIQLSDKLTKEITDQQANLGPGSSRERDFMSGTIGTSDPQFTRLRNDASLLATKLMRMHVGARGGGQMMEHFMDMLNVKNQSPENLLEAVRGIREYAQEVAGSGNQGSAQAAASVNSPKTTTLKFDAQGNPVK